VRTTINNPDGSQTIIALQDGALITGTVQDCTATAEDAKARHNAGMFGSSDMRHAGRYDGVMIEKYLNKHNITWQEFGVSQEHKRRFLMDPDLSAFRIWKGKI
jgi:hypothetical protein